MIQKRKKEEACLAYVKQIRKNHFIVKKEYGGDLESFAHEDFEKALAVAIAYKNAYNEKVFELLEKKRKEKKRKEKKLDGNSVGRVAD